MLKRNVLGVVIILLIGGLLSPLLVSSQTLTEQYIAQFNGFAGILAADLATGEILFSHNQDKLFVPASLVKIFTLLAGLEILGAEYRYPTSFYFSSSIPGEIPGNLYIKGSGDPTHSPEIISEMAQSLVNKYGIRRIEGDLILDDSLFQKKEFWGKGWMWDDQNPLIGALAIKGYCAREKHISYYNAMSYAWGEIFYKELLRLGVIIRGKVRIDTVQENIDIKLIHYSDTLESILVEMMKMSDNQSSEIIFRTLPLMVIPQPIFDIEQSLKILSELFFDLFGMKGGEDYFLVDGCGLSEYNLLTPAQIVGAISYLYQKYGLDILKYFANTDEKGTIKNRFSFPFWAKTGSLPAASGLAGLFQTQSGRDIAFCLMENNFRGQKNDPKLWENQLIQYFYENF